MIKATIRVKEGYYQGEDPNHEVPVRATDNALRSGFHNHNHTGDMIDALIFSDEPKEHWGEVGIRGAMDRIMRYMRYGYIATGTITVEVKCG